MSVPTASASEVTRTPLSVAVRVACTTKAPSGTPANWNAPPAPEIWVPMDKEDLRDERVADLSAYRVDATMMKLAKPDAVLLHCLPAFREQEVSSEVLDGPQSLVLQQAANRLFTMQALFHTLSVG